MSEFFLFLFPIAITTILVWGAGVRSKRARGGEAWDLEQAKSLQAFAALMIILHHMVQRITDYGGVNKGPVTAWNSFGILFTSIFFFFSGFGLYKSQRDKEQYLKNFLRHRLPMILIPFLLTNIIYLIFVSGGRIGGVTDVFTSIFGFTLMNGNAWFIVELVFLYLAYYVCFRWSRSERAAICKLTVFTVLLVSVSLLLGHDGSKVGGHWFMGEWWYNTTLIFIMGFLFGKYEDPLKAFLLRRWKLLLPISVVLLIGWYILMEFVQGRFGYYREWEGHPGYPEKLLTLLVQLILCMLFVFVLLLVNLKIEFRNPVLTFLGGISLEVYLIHDVFRKGLPGGTGGQMPDLLYLALTYALTILSAWVLSKVDHFLIDRYHRLGKIRRTLIILTLIGFLGGILIEVIIGMCVSSQEDWFFDRPSMIWQLIGSGLYGAVAMGGSIVYQFERWGLLKATLVHYTLTLAAFLITNAALNWFPASVLAIVLILFTVVYFIIWLVQYLRWKKTIQEMNQDLERLADQKKNEEEHL